MVAWGRQDADDQTVGRLLGAHVLIGAVIALPVLPPAALVRTPIPAVNDTLTETLGWPELAAQIAAVVGQLPEDERANVVLLTRTYGEAGALDRYGPSLGLPQPYSGHNSYWSWRRPDNDDATVVAIRYAVSTLEPHFGSCLDVGRVQFDLDVDNEVHGAPIVVCRDLQERWQDVWPQLRHLS